MLVVDVKRRHGHAQRGDEQIAKGGEKEIVPNAGAEYAQLAEPPQAIEMIVRELSVS